ncbi:hypothetical protein GNI_051060 [Gregarina niphandrodes]|uniref:Uncharacterized protein n=1 Tax=Gregarina niphandrodes TaxID=110365 RepID=A0A023B9D9_GRENI|nr:hypothetical protein GNI_051060 [Gregarina niphandrodes]EZG72686.1 hypothetical protein GNI_051060 [Gregarina niphandrodes]|eukprot:XP_011129770.1 hypothetical protein GNI_051060 [Gregarina niphandrodes]
MLASAVRAVVVPVAAPAANVSVGSSTLYREQLVQDIHNYGVYCWDAIRYMGFDEFLAQDTNMGYMSAEFAKLIVAVGDLSEVALADPKVYVEELLNRVNGTEKMA